MLTLQGSAFHDGHWRSCLLNTSAWLRRFCVRAFPAWQKYHRCDHKDVVRNFPVGYGCEVSIESGFVK